MTLGRLHYGSAIGIAQSPVSYHGVKGVVLELFHSIAGRGGSGHGVSSSFQDGALQGDYMRFIIDAQDFSHEKRSLNSDTLNCWSASMEADIMAAKKGSQMPLF